MLAVVFYNPTVDQIMHAVEATDDFARTCFIFNSSTPHLNELRKLHDRPGATVLMNSENLGIARAINQAIEEFASASECALLLMLDQDTKLNKDIIPAASAAYKQLSARGNDCFALSATLQDMKANISEDHVGRAGVAEKSDFITTDAAATSGTFFTHAAIARVGQMREDLFIDGVDHDWCLRAKVAGVSIFQVKGLCLQHSIGDVGLTVLGRFFPLHTSPARHYFIVRNSLYLFLFGSGSKRVRFRILLSALFRIFPYLWVSTDALKSGRLMLGAVVHGVTGKLGPLG